VLQASWALEWGFVAKRPDFSVWDQNRAVTYQYLKGFMGRMISVLL
jgi:hypothetical protein